MRNVQENLFGDMLAWSPAVVFFQFLFELFRIDGELNWTRLILDSVAGSISLFIGFLAWRNRVKRGPMLNAVFSVLIGSSLWIILKTLKGILLDWGFLSSHPDQIYVRHLGMAIKVIIILVPVISVTTLSFILASRFIRKALVPNLS